jgi:nucleoid DNA-binding protein
MNTSELAKEVATAAGIPVARAENIIRFTFATIAKAVAGGDTVKLA